MPNVANLAILLLDLKIFGGLECQYSRVSIKVTKCLYSRHRLYIFGYLIQLLLLCSFVDCGFRIKVSSRVRVSVSFIFLAFFRFRCRLKEQKLAPGRLPPWLSGTVFRLHCIG